MKKSLLFFCGFILVAFVAYFGTMIFLEKNRYDFHAQSSNGEISFNSLNGKNRIVYFGFTYCPDICPLTLEVLKKSMQEAKNIDDEILLLLITLDPERDSAGMLDEYAKFFHQNSLGLRIDIKKLPLVANKYGIKYEKVPMKGSAMTYSVAHNSALFLFDKNGNLLEKITNLTQENVTKSLETHFGKS